MSLASRLLGRFVDIKPGEGRAVACAFAYFFSLLSGYYVLRPIRDEMGIQGGVRQLPWLFSATFASMLILVPVHSWVVGRVARRAIVPVVYRFFVLNIVVFWALFASGALSEEALPIAARAFYVWSAVYNLFVVTIFWSVLADLFSAEQSKRVFAFIAAGGTAGAILGPVAADRLAGIVGPVHLMLFSALLLEGSVAALRALLRSPPPRPADAAPAPARDRAIGGRPLDGIEHVLRSPYLLVIALQTLLYATVNTFLYLEQQALVGSLLDDPKDRTQLFATSDLVVNTVSLTFQLLVTGPLLSRVGLGAGLGAVPAAGAAGAAALAFAPGMLPIVLVNAVRRGIHFGVERPSREALFTVVPDSQKYKAKGFIDTVVYRGTDAASAWAHSGLRALGLATSHVFLAAVPVALAGLGLAAWLARKHAVKTGERSSMQGEQQ